MFVQDFEVVMMLVDEQLRDRLESHCFVDRPMQDEERVEFLFKAIHSMYKKKDGSPTDNKDRFHKRKQKVGESITEFTTELKDVLYQAWLGMPRDKLEDLLNEYLSEDCKAPRQAPKSC